MSGKWKIMCSVVVHNGGSKNMITAETRARIRHLVINEHQPIRKVARMLEISRNTVRRCVRSPNGLKDSCRSGNGRFLAEYQQEVLDLYRSCEYHCPSLQRLLAEKFDVNINLRMLQRFCQNLKKEISLRRLQTDVPMRYETAPAQHMQIDFGQREVLMNGEKVVLHIFVCKLSYSRRLFAKAYYAETQAAWLDGMESAFHYFGGLPYCIVCDNATSLVRNHYAKDPAARFTERFWHFCSYYNLKPIATSICKPRSKGKIENAVHYVKRNMAGVDKPDLQAWNLWLEKWCLQSDQRKLSTVFEGALTPQLRWFTEKEEMRPCDKPRMVRYLVESRKVGRDGLIRVDNKQYRLPNSLVGTEVQVQIDEATITVMRGKEVVATLDKTAGTFNPKVQKTSTGDPAAEAARKKVRELCNDERWRNFRDSPNELVGDGGQYDDAVGWNVGEGASWA